MNALRNTLQRSAVVSGRRFASGAMPKPLVPDVYQYSVKKAWFSDSSTYPLLAALTVACSLVVGASVHSLMYYKDLRINPSHKHETIQSWGTEKVKSMTSVVSEGPSFHRDAFKSLHGKEGMGVDHEAWVKSKKEYLEK